MWQWIAVGVVAYLVLVIPLAILFGKMGKGN